MAKNIYIVNTPRDGILGVFGSKQRAQKRAVLLLTDANQPVEIVQTTPDGKVVYISKKTRISVEPWEIQ